MGERRGTKALELWCRRITDGYPGVSVQNMTTSWRDGLAFCAMIHHFRPDLIDFSSLNKDDIYGNNELAFRTAEQHLGIPALLDAEDMASCAVPDRLSILTYLSQFYQVFGGSSPSKLVLNRTSESSTERISSVPESPKPKVGSRLGMRREQCSSCGLPVFLAEKLVVARSVYHRSCFRCARCRHQLTPGNYYETEAGQYCCEACPDLDNGGDPEEEEEAEGSNRSTSHHLLTSTGVDLEDSPSNRIDPVLEAPLSDEEKSKRRSLERASVEQLLRKQRSQLELVSGHLLADRIGEIELAEPSLASSDRVDGLLIPGAEVTQEHHREPKPESDEVKSARQHQQRQQPTGKVSAAGLLLPEDERDDKFDEMIKRINERIDELTTDEPTPVAIEQPTEIVEVKLVPEDEKKEKVEEKKDEEDEDVSLDIRPGRDTRINSAPDLGEHKRTRSNSLSDDESKRRRSLSRDSGRDRRTNTTTTSTYSEDKRSSDAEAPALRRSSSLRSPSEYTKDQRPDQPRRLSLVQRRLRLFEPESPRTTRNESPEPVRPERSRGPSPSSPQRLTKTTRSLRSKPIPKPTEDEYPEELNPFASDDETSKSESIKSNKTKKPPSNNPFGSSSDEEEHKSQGNSGLPPKPSARPRASPSATETPRKRVLEAPKISLNPFWSDEEGGESGAESEPELRDKSPPVPRPRTLRHSHQEGVNLQIRSNLLNSSIHSSNTSIASACSTMTQGGTYRKKKPAPLPPGQSPGTPGRSLNSSASSNPSLSPRLTPRTRKTKPAPPPPMATSTPSGNGRAATLARIDTEVSERQVKPTPPTPQPVSPQRHTVWDEEKLSKDEANRTTQSLSCNDNSVYLGYDAQDKSIDGKWKRKKGPAPPRPMPLRRKIKVMSMKDVKLELDQIEMQQQGLEKQGVRLEQIIRDKCESGGACEDTSLGLDVEELVLELFALVNEKNELFRRQAELMLLRRQQRLEEEHADIEYQVRCLISQSEATKTDFDKQREEALIQRLVEIVERRNEIVECLEMDRRREIEEDRSIHREMDLYAARNKAENVNMTDESRRSTKQKKGKVKEKVKEKKTKKGSKKDADKDVDESESKHKRHSLRKWF